MSKNPEIFVFTQQTLREHDMELAAKVHQVTVLSTIRVMNNMTPPQQLAAAKSGGKSLYWPEDKLLQVVDHISKKP